MDNDTLDTFANSCPFDGTHSHADSTRGIDARTGTDACANCRPHSCASASRRARSGFPGAARSNQPTRT